MRDGDGMPLRATLCVDSGRFHIRSQHIGPDVCTSLAKVSNWLRSVLRALRPLALILLNARTQ